MEFRETRARSEPEAHAKVDSNELLFDRHRRRDAEALSVHFQCWHSTRIESYSLGQSTALPRERALARQANCFYARYRGTCPAGRRGPTRLTTERVGPAERRRIDCLDEYGRSPARGLFGPSESAESLRQRLDQEGESNTFVPVIRSTGRQNGAGRIGEQDSWVICRSPDCVECPGARELPPLAAQSVGHAVCGDRRTHVDEDWIANGRDTDGYRVRRENRLPAAKRSDGGDCRIGAGDDQHQPAIRSTLKERSQAANVMTAPNDDCREAMHAGSIDRQVDCFGCQPDSR